MLLTLAATGCGARPAAEPLPRGLSGEAAVADATEPAAGGADVEQPDATGGGGDAVRDTPGGGSTPAGTAEPREEPPDDFYENWLTPPPHNDGTLTIRLSARCVPRGTTVTATFQGPPKAGIAAVVGYADNQAHGSMITGWSDDQGRFVWPIAVAPTAPAGPATLMAQTTGPDGGEGGASADAKFTVVDHVGECQ